MNNIEVNGHLYEIMKMPPREQFHMLRRLAPLMTSAGTAALGLLDESKSKEEVMGELIATIGPMAEVLASMKDEDLDYVLNSCLMKVRRLDSDKAWHPIYVQSGRGIIPMYSIDIDMGVELRLCAEVIKANLSGFFGPLSGAGASSLSAPGEAPAAQ